MLSKLQRAGRFQLPLPMLALAAACLLIACGDERSAERSAAGERVRVSEALSGEAEAEGYARALGPRAFLFPWDHGAHPAYRHEWWYTTGNLESEDGRHFGFQVTFFRIALAPSAAARPSAWATRQLWMAHFTVTDTQGERFYHFERFARGALGLAGAEADPFRVWLEDWALEGEPGAGMDQLQATLEAEGVGLDLSLAARKPLILQGDRGYSRKGAEPGNASYYYSLPRLAVEGRVVLPDGAHRVTGSAWIDREWGSSALSEGQAGWDWFSLQLEDGSELMVYHLRQADGRSDPHSAGTWIDASGRKRSLDPEDFELEVLECWRSPDGGARYPIRWRVRYPAEGLDLELRPTLADQELRGGFRYWEGAVRGEGRRQGAPVRAVGYVEMTGYADE
ncbi:MAG: lipocalin-like domain-containing protein [Halorhodospira sp.]